MIRYVVVAIGDDSMPAEDEDCEAIADLITRQTGLTATVLDERMSKRLTIYLVMEGMQ